MAENESRVPEIVLVQYPGLTRKTTFSPPCAKVHMALQYKGLPFRVQNVQSPMQVKKHNPRGRVPVLRFGRETILDSTDILTFLDERFPDPPLLPADPRARTLAKILEDWADEVVYFYAVWKRWIDPGGFARMKSEVLATLPIPLRWFAPWIASRTTKSRLRGQGTGLKDEATVRREFGECLDAISGLLAGGEFLTGETITRADMAVCSVLDQMRVARLNPDADTEFGPRGDITAWIDRVHEVAPNAAE